MQCCLRWITPRARPASTRRCMRWQEPTWCTAARAHPVAMVWLGTTVAWRSSGAGMTPSGKRTYRSWRDGVALPRSRAQRALRGSTNRGTAACAASCVRVATRSLPRGADSASRARACPTRLSVAVLSALYARTVRSKSTRDKPTVRARRRLLCSGCCRARLRLLLSRPRARHRAHRLARRRTRLPPRPRRHPAQRGAIAAASRSLWASRDVRTVPLAALRVHWGRSVAVLPARWGATQPDARHDVNCSTQRTPPPCCASTLLQPKRSERSRS